MATKKPAAKRKVRRFAEGGISDAQEEWLTRGGQSPDRTDPYILARMRSAVPDAPKDTYENNAPYKSDDQGLGPNTNVSEENKPSTPVTKTVTKVAVTKPQADWENNKKMLPGEEKPKLETPAEYKSRMEGLMKKDALEEVHPEDYVPGGGMLKGMLGYVTRKGLKTYTPAAIRQLEGSAARQIENNTTKQIGLDKSMYKSPVDKAREARANTRTSQMKQDNYDAGPAGRARASGAMVDDLTPGSTDLLSREMRPDFKRGGKVKPKASKSYKSGGSVKASSASRRADGCAIRGKTRA